MKPRIQTVGLSARGLMVAFTTTLIAVQPAAQACSRVLWAAPDNQVFVGRTHWAFLMRDWTTGMKLPRGENTTRTLKKFTVSLSAPGVHSTLRIHFPVFGWEVTVGKVRSVYLGLFVSNRMQYALRFHLVNNSDLVGDHPWPDGRRPFVYALDRVTGEVDYMNPRVTESHALGSVMPSYKQARIGPNIMPAAFRDYYRCTSCGYRKACYGERDATISEAIVERLLREDKHERFHLTGFVEPKQDRS